MQVEIGDIFAGLVDVDADEEARRASAKREKAVDSQARDVIARYSAILDTADLVFLTILENIAAKHAAPVR